MRFKSMKIQEAVIGALMHVVYSVEDLRVIQH